MTDETAVTDDRFEGDESPEEALARLEAELAEWKDVALRATAEAENIRRRGERETNDARAYAITRFARDLLGVADNLARALQAAPRDHPEPGVANLATGIEMTEKELLAAFERNGLVRQEPAVGDKFDPNLHQAMMEQPSSEVPAGCVVSTLQPGYQLFGRIVRPAMVVVAARSAEDAAAAEAYSKAESGGPDVAGGSLDTKA